MNIFHHVLPQKRGDCFVQTTHWPFIHDLLLLAKKRTTPYSDLTDSRKIFFQANSLKTLFKDISWDPIFDFLKELNAFNKL